MKEVDLGMRLVPWLESQHWDVYQEVQFHAMGKVHDVVAVKDRLMWIIELKQALSFAVLEQAWRATAHMVSIAVPGTRAGGRAFAYKVCRDHGIGVILFDHNGVQQYISPSINRSAHRFVSEVIDKLRPEQKVHSQAGSNHRDHFTPYRGTMNQVKWLLQRNGRMTLKQIVAELEAHHYCSDKSAMGGIRKALTVWESDWCRCDIIDGKAMFSLKTTGVST